MKKTVLLTVCFCLLLISACQKQTTMIGQVQFDEEALFTEANGLLNEAPLTITAYPAERSAGGLHDFYSEGPYWWPNPDDPDGPYIRRDGVWNHDKFSKHNEAIRKFCYAVPTLLVAYQLSGDEKYAQHAVKHLQAWFVDAETKMNPNLLYGQAIKGIVTGRGIGLIGMVPMIEVALSIDQLRNSGFLQGKELQEIVDWFDQFATWMTTHQYGIDERDNGNNHSTWWGAQIAAYSIATQRTDLMETAQQQFKKYLPLQMEKDGRFPEELARTRPYHYTIYNLEAWTALAILGSTQEEDLWNYQGETGSLKAAIDYFVPYMHDISTWELPPDVQGFEDQPRQTNFLLFAAQGYEDESLLDLWRKLENEKLSKNWHLLLYKEN